MSLSTTTELGRSIDPAPEYVHMYDGLLDGNHP
jgi:hypothetical protein